MMDHVVTTVPFYRDRTLIPGYDVGGKTGTAQIWDPKANKGRGGWKHNNFNYSFVGLHRAREGPPGPRRRGPDRGGHARPSPRVGQIEMPVMSFELFRRIAHDAITTPDLLTAPTTRPLQPTPRPRRPVSAR